MGNGLTAFTTFSAMNLHFKRGNYDGWKYNFKTRVSEEKFLDNKALMFQFAAIERDYPTLQEQLAYFYPAFSEFGYIQTKNIKVLRTCYCKFSKRCDTIESVYESELKKVASKMKNILDLLDNSGTMPEIFNLYDSKKLSYDSIVILFLLIPELNKIVSNDPFLFDSWKTKVSFDMKFYSSIIAPSRLKTMKKLTIDIFKNIQ